MGDELRFLYQKEFWFISAFLNSGQLDVQARERELEALLSETLHSLSPKELERLSDPLLAALALDAARSATLRCRWHSFLEGFPYHEENTSLVYNKLGYFEIEVEYFPGSPSRRQALRPVVLQQLPALALARLKRYSTLKVNSYLYLDTVSPIFTFVVSDSTTPEAPPWDLENIERHKREIGTWTEIYSGAWPDYTDTLYSKRVENNLSNRLSELHFIRKNSGFVYMAGENYRRFFDSYMRRFVLAPTAELRAMHFALISINESLDILFLRQAKDDFLDLSIIEAKLANLRQLRGALQMQMSEIYNELDSNKRQHYSAVLDHLLREFNLTRAGLIARVNEKFDLIYDSMQRLYQRRQAENQERTERGLGTLNILFSLGILADFAALLLGAFSSYSSEDRLGFVVNGLFSFVVLAVFLVALLRGLKTRLEARPRVIAAADAVVHDGAGRVLVITRRSPPYRDQYALPGTFVSGGEPAERALLREVREETNLEIEIERELGTFCAEGRDPRGRVVSRAFLCRATGDLSRLRAGDDAVEARFVPLAELDGVDLAFDHEDILAAAKEHLSSAPVERKAA